MRYAVFARLLAEDKWGLCVGLCALSPDAEAMACRSLAEGRLVSIRSITPPEGQQLAALPTWCGWVLWEELPGVEFSPDLEDHR